MISDVQASIDDVPAKFKTSLYQAFLQVVDVMNLCFMHALLYNSHISKFQAHVVHSDEAMIHLMQFSLIISHCNVTFSML